MAAGYTVQKRDDTGQIPPFIILQCHFLRIIQLPNVIMVTLIFTTLCQPLLMNISKTSPMLRNHPMTPNTKHDASRLSYLNQVCSVAYLLTNTFQYLAVSLPILCTSFHATLQTFSSTFGVEPSIVTHVTIMIHGIGLSSKTRLGRFMVDELQTQNCNFLDLLTGHSITLQKKILVDIKHGNFSSMYLLLDQVCF